MNYLTLVVYLITVIFNVLGSLGILTGYTVKDISEKYISLVTPANYTFIIWLVIYVALLVYTLYSCNIIKNENSVEERKLISSINSYYFVNLLLNILWIITWVANLVVISTIFMILIFLTLYKISMIIKNAHVNDRQFYYISLPFNLYFGWITVAMLANLNVFIVKIGVNPVSFLGILFTIVLLVLGFIIFVLTYYKNRSLCYLFSIIWGYIGIGINNITEFLFIYKLVFVVELIIILLLLYLFVKDLLRRYRML